MSVGMGIDLEAFRKSQRADGFASILAIGTANPPNVVDQSTYPDYYFRITNNEDNTDLKDKFKRICKFSSGFMNIIKYIFGYKTIDISVNFNLI